MKVEGSCLLNIDRARAWAAFQDPEVLSACIPGCQKFQPAGDDSYDVVLRVGVAAISGTYTGKVRLTDKAPPESYRMIVEGSGSGGTVRGEAVLCFSVSGGETAVRLDADAQVSGVIARVGQRLLGGVSKMLVNQFFECIKAKVEANQAGKGVKRDI